MSGKRTTSIILGASILASWVMGWGGCSTSKIQPPPPIPPTPPSYVQVPHPEGLDIGDLMAIFVDRSAPNPEALKNCDADYQKLRTVTQSKLEFEQGVRELVRFDPVKYHWCFYGKLMAMEDQLKKDTYLDERQNHVINAYLFLTPIGRAFLDEYKDSRYLRWAIVRYRRLSEFVFYRKLELSQDVAAEIGASANPFGLYREPKDQVGSILEKYGIVRPGAVVPMPQNPTTTEPNPQPQTAGTEPVLLPDRAPSSQKNQQPEPTPTISVTSTPKAEGLPSPALANPAQ